MQNQKPNFPFSAVTGQHLFKLALTLVAVNPAIGGVLVSGPRGSAKSTLAKGLADVMPESISDAASKTSPAFVTLPLSATEEMVVGTLNLQDVLSEKKVSFQEGLLAKANNGVLYVDEVNLLQDHIVDLLLDVAASGVNIIERDGISYNHEAKFILLGTMNPDEGELRPQLQDRFGLSVKLGHEYDIAERIEIVQRREAYDINWQTFLQQYQDQQETLKNAILATRSQLPNVDCPLEMQELIAHKCHAAHVDGLRADIVWYRAALTHAALHERLVVTEDDINAVEELVLSHRRNNKSNSQDSALQGPSKSNSSKSSSSSNEPQQHKPFSRPKSANLSNANGVNQSTVNQNSTNQNNGNQDSTNQEVEGDWGKMHPQQLKTAERIEFDWLHAEIDSQNMSLQNHALKNNAANLTIKTQYRSNKQFSANSSSASSYATNKRCNESNKVNWLSSLLTNAGQWPLQQLKFYQSRRTQTLIHLVLIDTSASTLKNNLFSQAKAIILKIAEKAYIKREQLSIIGFGNQSVETLLPRQRAPKALREFLDTIPAAGGTPLREALEYAESFRRQQHKQTPNIRIKTYIITDGKTRQSFAHIDLGNEVTLIDIEKSTVKRGKGQSIAKDLNAHYIPLFTA